MNTNIETKSSQYPGKMSGFAVLKTLVVIALFVAFALLALAALNPAYQRLRLYDIKRKRDLNILQGLFTLYNKTNGHYPTGKELCYNSTVQVDASCSCHICGLEKDLGTFGHAIQVLYCDPEHPKSDYVYENDCTSDPQWYKVYTHLSAERKDTKGQYVASTASCSYGITSKDASFLEPYSDRCGGDEEIDNSREVQNQKAETAASSPILESCPADPVPKYCTSGDICSLCGNLTNCQSAQTCDHPLTLFSNSLCTNQCS